MTQITSALITDPERYLLIINNVLLSLNVVMLITAGVIVYYATRNIALSLLVQCPPLLFTTVLTSFARVTPEPFLLAVSILLACLLILFLKSSSDEEENNLRLAKYLGLVSGLGIALKLTFAPVVLLPLFIMKTAKLFKSYIKYVVIGFIVFTLPLLLKFPLFKQYRDIIKWACNLFLGSGIYGYGPRTIINIDRFLADIWRISIAEPLYLLIVMLAVITFLSGIRKIRYWNALKRNLPFCLLSGLILIHIITLIMVAKHPQSERYLIPALGLSGFTIVVVYLFAKEQVWQLNFSSMRKKILLGCIGVCLIVFVTYRIWNITVSLDPTRNKHREELLVREKIVQSNYSYCAQVHQDSATKPFALFFGLQWSRRSEITKKVAKEFFEKQKLFTYDPGSKEYYSMSISKLTLDDIKRIAPCVIKVGPGAELKVL